MPYTFNGIGTMYYGKKNLEKYESVCENCGRAGWLKAYETRLWFTLFFIPLVPMERKQVIDYCPSCSSHRAVSLEEWGLLKEQTPPPPGENEKENEKEDEKRDAASRSNEPDTSPGSGEAIDNHLNLLHRGNEEEAETMARWLEKPGPGITAHLDELVLLPELKRVLYAAFSRLYPPEGRRLLARAGKMNYFPSFPYHYIKKLVRLRGRR